MNFSKSKKLIIISAFIICFLILSYGIIKYVKYNEATIHTNATPLTNKVIVVDGGHRDSGHAELLVLMVQQSKL